MQGGICASKLTNIVSILDDTISLEVLVYHLESADIAMVGVWRVRNVNDQRCWRRGVVHIAAEERRPIVQTKIDECVDIWNGWERGPIPNVQKAAFISRNESRSVGPVQVAVLR